MHSERLSVTPKVIIRRHDRSPVTVDSFTDPARMERIIVEEFKARRDLGRRNRVAGVAALTWLKDVCYRVILSWLADDLTEETLKRLDEYGRFARGTPDPHRDVFDEGIVAILAATPRLLTSRDRAQLADPMWYGFRHYIPAPLLSGFNHQYPGHKGRDAKWRSRIEPALEDWVVEQRVKSIAIGSHNDAFRGRYPSRIEKRVTAEQTKKREAEEAWQPITLEYDEDWTTEAFSSNMGNWLC